jgi:HEAT repeat protein
MFIVTGEFCFPAVISGLTEMLKDEDPNIRAIATIALAKSGKLMKRQ